MSSILICFRYGVCWAQHDESDQHSSPSERKKGNSGSSCVYTGRPGQRVWRADTSGAVAATLLIKDLPHQARIYINKLKQIQKITEHMTHSVDLQESTHKDDLEEARAALRFENIQVLDTGQLVLSATDSLVIFNPNTLQVEAFIYETNFCRDISTSQNNIFILNKESKLFCISSRPLNIGSNVVKVNRRASNTEGFVSPATLKKFGNKFFQQGSSLLDNVSKYSGVIASKVSKIAQDGNVVNGHFEDLQDNYSRNLQGELNTVTKQRILSDPTSLQNVGGMLRQESQDPASTRPQDQDTATLPWQHSHSLVAQSLYDLLPSEASVTTSCSPAASSTSKHSQVLAS